MENALRGHLVIKGEAGMSAYELALKNGFVGTEQDWLATLGTSSHFNESTIIHTSTASQTSFDLPSGYTSNSFIDVYVNGLRLNSNEFTINTSTQKINLIGVTLTAGQTVEIVVLTMSTNALPIIETIKSDSTNEEAAGAKAVYTYVNTQVNAAETRVNTEITSTNSEVSSLKTEVSTLKSNTTANLAKKFDTANIKVLTGSIAGIAAGATKTVDIAYPSGFTKDNTIILSKLSSSNNVYYDNASLEDTASGYPTISTVALTDSTIRVWLKNNNASEARIGYYKLAIMKV